MLCPIKVKSNRIELTVHTSCYCVLDLLCVMMLGGLNTIRPGDNKPTGFRQEKKYLSG